MSDILTKVIFFLDQATRGEVKVSPELLDEFAANCRKALERQFNDPPKDKFTLRMSNVGRPLCQLQMEKAGVKAEPPGPYDRIRSLHGDLTEAMVMAIIKAAGVNVTAEQEQVSWNGINGTLDVEIDDVIYDIKSASPYAFSHKFGPDAGGFTALSNYDTFGYVSQGFGYAEAKGKRFGGWIAMDKSSGELNVVETPDGREYERARHNAIVSIENTKEAIDFDAPFKRCFDDMEELYYKKPTGNRVLNSVCSFCPYKFTCWPELQAKPALVSEALNPPVRYYTHIDEAATERFRAERARKRK